MNSPIYQLLCQTLQNKILSDQKDPSITGTETMMGSKNMVSINSSRNSHSQIENKIKTNKSNNRKIKHDPRIHQTNLCNLMISI